MKNSALCLLFIFLTQATLCQVLLEDKKGDQIANNSPLYVKTIPGPTPLGIDTRLIKLNTGDQSLGFNYIITTKNINPANYKIYEFGLNVKSTDGFGPIFSDGQFSPGLKATYSLTQVHIFFDNSGYTDWGGINVSYDINKYTLYKSDPDLNKQFYSKDFKALNLSLNYNALIQSKWIANTNIGYSRRNNADELSTIDAQDISSSTDVNTQIVRQIIRKRSARAGIFLESDTYPMIFAITRATPTDAAGSPAAGKLRIGYTFYLKNLVSNQLPQTDAGLIFFFTKQNPLGVRAPVFGFNILGSDPFDVHKLNNGLQNRLTVGFTTIFTL